MRRLSHSYKIMILHNTVYAVQSEHWWWGKWAIRHDATTSSHPVMGWGSMLSQESRKPCVLLCKRTLRWAIWLSDRLALAPLSLAQENNLFFRLHGFTGEVGVVGPAAQPCMALLKRVFQHVL